MAERRRPPPEQMHQPEDCGQEEGQPDQQQRMGGVVAVGVIADDGEMSRRVFLALRVQDGSGQQHERRRDHAEPCDKPPEVTRVRQSEHRLLPRGSVCPSRRRRNRSLS